jgi:CheY-like chemotaxis protein
LIKDLLDISQIEANKLVLRSEPCDVVALTHDVTTLFFQAAQQKSLRIDSQWLGQPDGLFRTDPIRLRQMLSNLVSNAIKFTESGFVHIVGQVVERNGAEAILEFSVSDSGIGIAADKIDLLFKRFSQVDASHTRSFEGTGLGLSIIEGLAKRMGGSVGVESQTGVGSRFWFRIQVVVLDATGNLWGDIPGPLSSQSWHNNATPVMVTQVAKPTDARGRGMAMVVEDNPINQKIVETALARMGLRAVCMNNGQEAVNAVTQGLKPVVILMDMQMPVMNGLEAARAIRGWELVAQTKRIPILGLTAGSGPEIEQECIDSGMDAVLFKPVDLDLLQAAVIPFADDPALV